MHFEKHKLTITIEKFRLVYALNGDDMLTINDLDLLSLETSRIQAEAYQTDSTTFIAEDEDLFIEQEWKGIIDDIPTGP